MSAPPVALGAQVLKHGTHIFVYSNIRTNQVVYSLTRSLNNHDSLSQLPYLGKKTVPAALRKDLWSPLALLSFPLPIQGLSAYRKLLEFRRLHETSFPLSAITQTSGSHKGQLMPKKARGKFLMNQKANSVADIAAVLLQQEKGPTEEQLARAERRVRRKGPLSKRGPGRQRVNQVEGSGGCEGVMVRWADLRDAEFAKTWPEAVVHDGLGKSRYTAAFPPPLPVVEIEPVEELIEEGKSETVKVA